MTTTAGRASEGRRRGSRAAATDPVTAVAPGVGVDGRGAQRRRSEGSRRGGGRVGRGLEDRRSEAWRIDDPRDNIENVAPVWV